MSSLQRYWPVLLLCCALGFTSMSFAYGLGAVFTDIMDTYRVSRATASLVQSVCVGLMFLIGTVTGHFQERFGPRVTVIAGSVLATAGCVIAFLATHIVQVIVGIGVLSGIGMSFNFLTGVTVAGTVFHDVRSLALGVHSIFTAAGSAVFPIILTLATEEYSLRGTFLILAAVNCQMVLCGVLIGFFAPRTPGKIEVTIELKKAGDQDAAVCMAWDGERHGNNRKSDDGVGDEDCRRSVQKIQDEERAGFQADHTASVDDGSLSCKLTMSRDSDGENSHWADLQTDDSKNIVLDSQSHHHHTENEPEVKIREQQLNEEYSRLLCNSTLEGNNGTEHATPVKNRSVEESSRRDTVCFCLSSFSILLRKIRTTSCFDAQIFRNTRFVIFAVFGATSSLYAIQPLIFMTDMVTANQLTAKDGSFFLTIIFVCNLLGRIVAGVLYKLLQSGTLFVYSVSVAAVGVTCLFFLFTHEYYHFVAVSAVLGLGLGILSANVPMIYMEILGPRRYAVGLGYVATVEGVVLLLAGPYAGLIRDLTNSYEPLYYIAAAHGLALGVLLVFTALRYRSASSL